MTRGLVLLIGMTFMLSACDLGYDDDDVKTETVSEVTEATPAEEVAAEETQPAESADESSDAEPADSGSLPVSLSQVVWLHTDVSDWRQTATLSDVYVQGDLIFLEYDKANSWPAINFNGGMVNANPWIFVQQGGTWYAATWEWLRPGQTAKSTRAVRGDHINASPLSNFVPRSGTQYGFMVSGLARTSDHHNVAERSNVVMMTWP